MAFTPAQEASILEMLSAFTNGKKISTLPSATTIDESEMMEVVQNGNSKSAPLTLALSKRELAANKKTAINDSDEEFPTSKSVLTALGEKLDKNSVKTEGGTSTTDTVSQKFVTDELETLTGLVGDMDEALADKAPLANPTFTGNVVIPDGDASNEAASKGQMDTADLSYYAKSVEMILASASAPTPALPLGAVKTYEFATGGTCAWITGGSVEVEKGDKVDVAESSENNFTYTYQNIAKRKAFLTYVDEQDALKEVLANKSTNMSTDANSTTKYPSVKTVKDYVDAVAAGLLENCGAYDASTNVFPTTGGSGVGGAVVKNDLWYISVEGVLAGKTVKVGSAIFAKVDFPAQIDGNWARMGSSLTYVPEDVANKSTNVTTDGASDTKYPSAKAVRTYADNLLTNSGANYMYNLTVGVPLGAGLYYTLSTAIAAVPVSVKKLGLEITFATGATTWTSYKFIGASISTWAVETDWLPLPISVTLESGKYYINI